MYTVGDKIIYGENGVCTVEKIAPLEMSGASGEKLYYYLTPFTGSGTYFAPVDSGAYMRPVMSRAEAEALIDAIPGIAPAVCNDSRFNHVDPGSAAAARPVQSALRFHWYSNLAVVLLHFYHTAYSLEHFTMWQRCQCATLSFHYITDYVANLRGCSYLFVTCLSACYALPPGLTFARPWLLSMNCTFSVLYEATTEVIKSYLIPMVKICPQQRRRYPVYLSPFLRTRGLSAIVYLRTFC